MIATDQHWLLAAAMVLYIAGIGLWETLAPAYRQAERQTHRRFTNFSLAALHLSLVLVLPLTQVTAAVSANTHGFGVLNQLELPSVATLGVTCILASLLAYLTHVILHKVPTLWRFHAIHHDDREIDASTALRHHPGEILLIAAIQTPVVVLLGLDPIALVFLYTCEWLHGLFAHANVRLPKRIDVALGYILVTPTMHAVHHSADREDADSNFGAMFSGWDRLFGTFRATAKAIPRSDNDTESAMTEASMINAVRAPLLAPLR
jgi:sterol desaturase/sphingolipid hydroxylase (fatty acid hydroxylase superfamily)